MLEFIKIMRYIPHVKKTIELPLEEFKAHLEEFVEKTGFDGALLNIGEVGFSIETTKNC